MTAQRICPICSSEFVPRTIRSISCSIPCRKRAEKLRAKGRAYDRGERGITIDTLAVIIRILEVDAQLALEVAAKADALWLDSELEDEAETARAKVMQAEGRAVDIEWGRLSREHSAKMKARGWEPLRIKAAPPDQRRRFVLNVPSYLLRPKSKGKDNANKTTDDQSRGCGLPQRDA